MSVIAVCGLPGKGKTLFATYLMKKKYKRENNIFKRFFSKKRFINIFSNYPIKLDDKKNIYSYKISLNDFLYFKKQVPDSFIVLDEFQSYFDSLEYKNFPKRISQNFQFHRHFSIKDIYLISQHPSRIVKQARVLVNEFYNITKFIKLPFGIAFLRYNIYYNFEDFGKSVDVKKEDVIYDFKKKIVLFKYKKVFKSYDTKYMKALVEDKDYIKTDMYDHKLMNLNDIKSIFNIN
ncbi:MAG: hypothetical protein IJB82_02320 [Bacilli bacterium]|nr:hypothetical protein [Bacilli bacterium]